MNYLDGQQEQSLELRGYREIIVVFGTRDWCDKRIFHRELVSYLEPITGPVLFLSGMASSGADYWIVRWARYFTFPCRGYPAAWRRPDGSKDYGAGFARNDVMARLCTRGLGFWDQHSTGTCDMIQRMAKYDKPCKVIEIPFIPKKGGR